MCNATFNNFYLTVPVEFDFSNSLFGQRDEVVL